MRLDRLLKNSAWGALAATMAMTALPAEAFAQRGESLADRANRAVRQEQRQSQSRQAPPRQAQSRQETPRQTRSEPPRRTVAAAPQGSRHDARNEGRRNESRQYTRGNDAPITRVREASRETRQVQRHEPAPSRVAQSGNDGNRGLRSSGNRPGNDRYRDGDRRGDNRYRDNNDRRDNDRYRDNDRRDGDRWRNDRNYRNDRTLYRNNHRDSYRSGYRDGRRDYNRWDRRWRDNNRYDWHRYRSHNRNIYRIGVYYSPYRSWSYRRLGIGYFLDTLFFSSRYWINDPWRYRLPAVYGPYRWVRYYDDVLLVDTYSGEVVDVIYDFFW